MFEFTRRHPDRVLGLFAVAGVPGDTFGSFFGAAPLPRAWRRALAGATARALGAASPVLTPVRDLLVRLPQTSRVVAHSGAMLPSQDPAAQHRAIIDFLDMEPDEVTRRLREFALGITSGSRCAQEHEDALGEPTPHQP